MKSRKKSKDTLKQMKMKQMKQNIPKSVETKKAVLRWKFLELQACIKKVEKAS